LFANKSRIVSLPGKEQTVRGFSGVSLLIIDEAAQVDEDLYHAVRPMLAVSDGRLILLSTPFGQRGFFWDTWKNKEGWMKVKITAKECPRLSPDFLAEERATFPDWYFEQEYNCVFAPQVSSVFRTEDIERAFHPEIFSRDDIDLEIDD
jgi:hypothetical protein